MIAYKSIPYAPPVCMYAVVNNNNIYPCVYIDDVREILTPAQRFISSSVQQIRDNCVDYLTDRSSFRFTTSIIATACLSGMIDPARGYYPDIIARHITGAYLMD